MSQRTQRLVTRSSSSYMVVEVTDQNFQQEVLSNTKPVLLDFYAVWCGPCKLSEPVLEELSKEYKDKVIIAKIDVDKSPKAPQDFGVMSIPTTILLKGGKEVARQVGFAGRRPYEELIAKA